MINLFNTQIEALSLHRVGNKSRNENPFYSQNPYRLSDEITPLLKEFFFKPFREKEENYFQFANEVSLEYNEMYRLSKEMFDNPENHHEISVKIAQHLYQQSMHPHIKPGEVYVTYLKNVSIDNNVVDAIGVFKTEILRDFIQANQNSNMIEIELLQGIGLDKLDKGCIIFNHKGPEGYKILTVDSNRYDARYWLDHFLGIDQFEDENFLTRKYLKLCNDFGKQVVFPGTDAKGQVAFESATLNYFAKNDIFEESNFEKEVFDKIDDGDNMVAEFQNFRNEMAGKYSLENVDDFQISNTAVNECRKIFKGVIKLDTNIEISLNFSNPESLNQFVEKGWDEEKQMYYYLCYFNKETK